MHLLINEGVHGEATLLVAVRLVSSISIVTVKNCHTVHRLYIQSVVIGGSYRQHLKLGV